MVVVGAILDEILCELHGGEDPRFTIVISVCTNSEIDLVRSVVLCVTGFEAEEWVWWELGNVCRMETSRHLR